MSKTNPTGTLRTANYSFDPARNAWYCGKKPVDEEEVLVYLIRIGKERGVREAGIWAGDELRKVKQSPELTCARFAKTSIVRNRNNRIAGKYLFENWARSVGIVITGKLEDFMVRNSLLVNRFYNELSAVFGSYRKQARVLGAVMNSVFFGLSLHEDVPAVHVPSYPVDRSPSSEGLRRYQEFMTKLFTGGPL